jgi:hypothetical protein
MERMAYELHKILTNGPHAKELRLFDLGDVFRERYRGNTVELSPTYCLVNA